MITLPSPCDALDERTITTAAGEFVLQFKTPTYQERLEDDYLSMLAFSEAEASRGLARQQIHRIERCCVGWSGVQDAGGENVPFSINALGQVLTAWPFAADQVTGILRELFAPKVPRLGEFAGRPAAGSAAAG